ncbi:MAG: hypothetical protein M3362_02220, partial [Acidobacteriota bacterium]|nr:hypothetical protein [Acidobacteriota bacterium]
MARKQMIVLDTCSSAKAFENFVGKVGDKTVERNHASARGLGTELVNEMLSRDVVVFTSAGETYESPGIKHGVLTYALLQGLKGEAAEMQRLFGLNLGGGKEEKKQEGLITTEVLEAYIYSKVQLVNKKLGKGKSRPIVYSSGGEFALG